MAVRSFAYQKQGGMNKRKAGEDFYFIHKIISLGNFTELKTSCIIPSPRISDRVPFGTGKAIGDWVAAGELTYETYAFQIFEIIKTFVQLIPKLWKEALEEQKDFVKNADNCVLVTYLKAVNFQDSLLEIRKNSKNLEGFIKRFYVWFDAFRILKIVHYLRDNGFENQTLYSQTMQLLPKLIHTSKSPASTKELLIIFRQLEKRR
jgi:hypothetical protein